MKGRIKYPGIMHAGLLLMAFLMFTLRIQAQNQVPPDIPDLIRVTVDHADNGVLIEWNPSTNTNIRSYQIYRKLGDVFVWLDSVSPSTFAYKHMNSGLKNLAYAVTALDSSSNESIFEDNYHRAVGLTGSFDLCSQSNNLVWTTYEGWEGNISGYRIFGAYAGGAFQELTFVQSSTTSFTHTGIDIDTTYVYYIETVHTSGIISHSSIDTLTASLPESPSYLIIDHVSVLDQASVEIQFTADITGPVNSFRVLRRSHPGTPFIEVAELWNVTESTQVVQDQVPTGSISYQYVVQSLFLPPSCSTSLMISQSNYGNNILLVNEVQNQVVTLSWTPYESYEAGLAGYIIQRRNGTGDFVDLETVGPLTTQWQESIQSLVNGMQPGQVQYRIVAIGNPSGQGTDEQSYSNITLATVESHLQVPSAFTPGSNDMNSEFKPLMDFAPREYIMIIMDRGGRKMFETTDPGEGWDGRFQGGEYVNEAVYVYYIQYTDYTGVFKTFTGNVTVLYP